jgi:hypothetical protein
VALLLAEREKSGEFEGRPGRNGGRSGYIREELGQHGGRVFGGDSSSNGGRSGAAGTP